MIIIISSMKFIRHIGRNINFKIQKNIIAEYDDAIKLFYGIIILSNLVFLWWSKFLPYENFGVLGMFGILQGAAN